MYAAAIFGGYVDKVLGYQRSILLGADHVAGLFMIAYPDETIFKVGLATVIAGNGLFKPNISTMVGKLYAPATSAAIRASPCSTWASTSVRSSRRS